MPPAAARRVEWDDRGAGGPGCGRPEPTPRGLSAVPVVAAHLPVLLGMADQFVGHGCAERLYDLVTACAAPDVLFVGGVEPRTPGVTPDVALGR